ncbi:nucleoporin NUP35-like [Corticium candelabrum]|uniref:nucleoporin NUP35-like n=1 Tax=Corticium candelabrum TaxID=121492 RepID=UPI002E26A30D|nr:nucleoporin NUP35-like [Corticium candelabrum]
MAAQDQSVVSPINASGANMGSPQGFQVLPRYLLGGGGAVTTPPGVLGPHQGLSSLMTSGLVHSTPASTSGLVAYGQQQAVRKERSPLTAPKDKSGAPPVEGLYDNSGYAVKESTPREPAARLHSQGLFTAVPSTIRASHPSVSLLSQSSPSSPAQLDPFYLHGESITCEDHFDDCWVTVFGYPPSSATYILQQFSQLGNILKHVVATNGNWMHLRYQSRLQAVKALSKNGKVFAGGIMVGVQPCIDKGVIVEGDQQITSASVSQNVQDTHTDITSRGGIRPLAAAYRAMSSQQDVEPREANTPQKNSGFVNKVLEYVLGW